MENLVSKINKDKLKELGAQVVRDYEDDYASLDEYREHNEKQAELVAALVDKKTFPWDDASNVKLPILTTAILQFQARARKALLPATGPVHVLRTGEEDFDRAERVKKWFNYQLYEDMPSWKRDMDLGLMRLGVSGTIFKKTYYDELHKRVESKLCDWDAVTMPYGTTCIEEAARISYRFVLTERDVKRRKAKGIFEYKDLKEDLTPEGNAPTEDTEDKSIKQKDTRDKSKDVTYEFIEQQLFASLMDDDEISAPYIVKVDRNSGYVVSVVSNNDSENTGEHRQWYTVYNLLPNIKSGVYGWGFGILLEGMNRSANTLVNQFIDAGTLANTTGGLIKKRSGMKRGDVKFRMGEWQEVDIFGERIQDVIYNYDFKGPNQALFQVLGLIFEQSDKVVSISDIATGQMPPRNTPAATIMALIEQGQMVFSVIHERIHDSLKSELGKIYRLNDEFINVGKYLDVLGDDMTARIGIDLIEKIPALKGRMAKNQELDPRQFIRAAANLAVRNDFKGRSDVIPVSDPNITSNAEKMIKAQDVLDRTMADPELSANPQVRWAARDSYYRAIGVENRDDVNPKPAPQEPPDLPPIEEEALWLMEQDAEPVEGQDHWGHYQSHVTFMDSMMGQNLTPEGRKKAQNHIQKTLAMIHREGLDGAGAAAVQPEAMAGMVQ